MKFFIKVDEYYMLPDPAVEEGFSPAKSFRDAYEFTRTEVADAFIFFAKRILETQEELDHRWRGILEVIPATDAYKVAQRIVCDTQPE